MSVFSDKNKGPKLPAHTLVIPPTSWAESWEERPTDEVAAGLRMLAEDDLQRARAHAVTKAKELHDDLDGQIAAFNDALMAFAVARSLCDPNDTTLPFIPMAEDNLTLAFTTDGIRRCWDELERVRIEVSPLTPQATDLEIQALVELLNEGAALEALPAGAKNRARKLLGFLLEELQSVTERTIVTVEDVVDDTE
jgi:hypothetical protein